MQRSQRELLSLCEQFLLPFNHLIDFLDIKPYINPAMTDAPYHYYHLILSLYRAKIRIESLQPGIWDPFRPYVLSAGAFGVTIIISACYCHWLQGDPSHLLMSTPRRISYPHTMQKIQDRIFFLLYSVGEPFGTKGISTL